MSERVLILQSDPGRAKELADYFTRRGDEVLVTADVTQANGWLRVDLSLVLVDLHLEGVRWLDLLTRIRQEFPKLRVIVTNRYPDLRRELLARDQGISVFLREPFTPTWIESALKRLSADKEHPGEMPFHPARLPKVRLPMRLKITFPYALLALIFAFAAMLLVSRYVLESIRDRFTNQLISAGQLSQDWMVQEETRLLDTLRLLSNMQGFAEAIQSGDADRLAEICLPVAVNYQEEAIEVLDLQGVSVLSLRHRAGQGLESYEMTRGDASLAGFGFVQNVLRQQVDPLGDKYIGLVQASFGEYVYVSGPVFDQEGRLVGGLLVGKSLTTLTRQIQEDTLAYITIYRVDGAPIASTLFLQEAITPLGLDLVVDVLSRQDTESHIRTLEVASLTVSEVLGPWEARSGEDLGLIGVSMAQNFSTSPTLLTRFQAIIVTGLAFVGIVILGVMLAGQITRPLARVVHASTQVSRGNFEVKVSSSGNDEVAVLATAFNQMVTGLQEGVIYRDILGRTVSPEVREALRQSFARGELRLEGHSMNATVLISDIRNFTRLSENQEPTTILTWLNEYFGEMVPVVTNHGGVVDKFEGDAMLTFFGILPTPRSPQESAFQACQAAADLLLVIERVNARRVGRGDPPLVTGIGINTGPLIAGGLGTSDRLNYTIIGDTVNTTQRLQEISREFGETGVVVNETTLNALAGRRGRFAFDSLGERTIKGKQAPVWLFRLRAADQTDKEGRG